MFIFDNARHIFLNSFMGKKFRGRLKIIENVEKNKFR